MMVLTHLILNDMVKVKGQISNLALCLVDSNPRMKELAVLFFSEMANKVGISMFRHDLCPPPPHFALATQNRTVRLFFVVF